MIRDDLRFDSAINNDLYDNCLLFLFRTHAPAAGRHELGFYRRNKYLDLRNLSESETHEGMNDRFFAVIVTTTCGLSSTSESCSIINSEILRQMYK